MINTTKRYKKGNALIDKSKEQNVWVYHQKSESVVLVSTDPNFNSADDMYEANTGDLMNLRQNHSKSINRVSESKQKQDKVYSTLRKVFLENKKECQIKLPGCTRISTEVHHLFSGSSRSKYYLVVSEWLASCRHCHDKVHNVMSKEEAIEKGLKKTY